MSTNFLLKIGFALLGIAIFFYVWDHFGKAEAEGDQVMGKFFAIIVGGIVAAFLVGMFVVPMLGDAVGNFFYSSGEKIEDDGSNAAAAMLAQGDYEGAAAEYKKIVAENPGESFPVWEAGKVMAEKLEDPDGAIAWVSEQLEAQEWDEDGAAFLMFRLAELHEEHKDDPDTALDLLSQVVGTFPGTRHAANATSKKRKMEQAMIEGNSRPKIDAQLPGSEGGPDAPSGGPTRPGMS